MKQNPMFIMFILYPKQDLRIIPCVPSIKTLDFFKKIQYESFKFPENHTKMFTMNHNIKKDLLLKTGQEIFAIHGFTNVGLSTILKQANIPKGSFYYYFDSKEAYGVEVINHYIQNYTTYMNSLRDDPLLSGKACLLTYWGKWQTSECVNEYQGHCLIIKLGSEVSGYSESMRQAFAKGVNHILGIIKDFIIMGQKDGSISAKIDPSATTQQLYQLWLGASLLVKIQKQASHFNYATQLTHFLLEK